MSLNHPDLEVAPIILEDLPENLGTSYSQLNTFRSCPQKWNYSYVRKLRKQERDLKFFSAGSWWHSIRQADSLERGIALESLRVVPENVELPNGVKVSVMEPDLMNRVWEGVDSWWNGLQAEEQSEWAEAYGDKFNVRLRDLNQSWSHYWADELRYEEPLATEMFWRRPLEFQYEGQTVTLRLAGVIDEVVWDAEKHGVLIRDHKTTGGQMKPRTTLDEMMESQLQLYPWGAYPIISTWALPDTDRLFVGYDRVRIGAPAKPQLNLDGTLSKSVSDYDYHTYLEWAQGPDGNGVPWGEPDQYYKSGPRKGVPKFGIYRAEKEVLDRLDTPETWAKWYHRTENLLNMHTLKTHLQTAVDTAKDTLNTKARIAQTGDAARSFGFQCNRCDFVTLCRAEMIGGVMEDFPLADYGLVRKDRKKEGR